MVDYNSIREIIAKVSSRIISSIYCVISEKEFEIRPSSEFDD